jgi:hypothetical protein
MTVQMDDLLDDAAGWTCLATDDEAGWRRLACDDEAAWTCLATDDDDETRLAFDDVDEFLEWGCHLASEVFGGPAGCIVVHGADQALLAAASREVEPQISWTA